LPIVFLLKDFPAGTRFSPKKESLKESTKMSKIASREGTVNKLRKIGEGQWNYSIYVMGSM